jgi:nucleotide-binding universal stress UspA family protein
MEVKKVLHPTDFSAASDHALLHAVEFAGRFGAELTIIHVRTFFAGEGSAEEFSQFDPNEYAEVLEKELEKTSGRLRTDRSVKTVLRHSVSAASAILEFSEESGSDLIVMGTHGKSALGRFFLGSVAEKVVRHASVPVVTVSPGREGYRGSPNYARILATFDFSEHSKKAVLRAREIAETFGAQLQILHVVEQGVFPGHFAAWKKQISSELPEIAEEASRSITETFGDLTMDNVDICVEVGTGDGKVHREITEFARRNAADLIVMGTYGLSGVEHMLLGSTTERVLRSAPCPVLAYHLTD